METTTYIKQLVTPQAKSANRSRKVWSIDLETVWLPFFTATNVMGDTAIPSDALGVPLRLAYNKDGTVKFSNTGKPVIRVAKDLSDSVRMVRDNFTAGLQAYSNGVALESPDGYKLEIAKSQEAGTPIITHDSESLKDAYAKMVAEQVEAELKAKQREPDSRNTQRQARRKQAHRQAESESQKSPESAKDARTTHPTRRHSRNPYEWQSQRTHYRTRKRTRFSQLTAKRRMTYKTMLKEKGDNRL